jgi:hypothetical protein
MYIIRELTEIFEKSVTQFPAILITGPRQSGKSTFVQQNLKNIPYVTFDDPINRDFAFNDPNGFLKQYIGKPVIFDEIQYVPSLLPHIKIEIDNDRKPGQWVMIGSQQFLMMKDISETLAGRIAILELAPFSLRERGVANLKMEEILWNGFFPEPACYPEKRDLWIKSYIETYLERDARRIENIRDFHAFERFINLCAAYHSQEFHPSVLARDCGVSQPTINSWMKILEASYLAIRLPPFFKNFGKRIVKAPKFYFTDPALVAFLTRQPSPEALLRGSMAGAFFEGLTVTEVWKTFLNSGQKPAFFFWRSHGGLEVDLIIQAQGRYWPVEIKLTATPSAKHVEMLGHFKKMAGEEASPQGVLVCNVNNRIDLPGDNIALPWFEFSGWLKENIIALRK